MSLLETMLAEFNDGRSKGYCCLAATLLPVEDLVAGLAEARREVGAGGPLAESDLKGRAALLRRILDSTAARLGISLKLRKYAKRKS